MIESLLARFGLDGPLGLGLSSVVIFAIGVILALISNYLIYPLVLRLTRWTPTNLDTRLAQAFHKPLSLSIVLLGVYLSVTLPYDLPSTLQTLTDRIAGIFAVILGVAAVSLAVSNTFKWYIEVVSPRTETSLDDRLIPMLRRITLALIYGLGALLALDLLNINISPLIAGLGLSGLAVALALQPTLANLFAGTYVMTEGVVNTGDYIELDNGIAGYVQDVSWRSTRLRTWTNNLVIIPNSRFAETIITNYQGPVPAVNLYLTCGVSYESDLFLVERVCQEVMADLLATDPRAVKEYGAYFGFENFDDSNVDFYLFVQARDRIAGFDLRSALIQRLHQRFREENIVINYPMRTLNLPGNWQPEAMLRGEGLARPATPAPRAHSSSRPRAQPSRREAPASNVVGGDDFPDRGGDGPTLDVPGTG